MQPLVDQNAKLITQVESWRSHLLDVGNRNPLISMSFHPTRGVLELMHPSPEGIWRNLVTSGEAGSHTMRFPWKRNLVPRQGASKAQKPGQLNFVNDLEAGPETKDWNPSLPECLACPKLRPDELVTVIGDQALDRRIRTLNGYAQLSLSEQGINCLFLAFGFLKWFESSDSNKEIRSPLILVPAAFLREAADSPWELLEAEDDIIDNLCLRQRFKQDFGLELPPLPELDQLEEDGARQTYLAKVKRAIGKNARWDVEDRCCIGRFAFPKVAMWQDLGDHMESIAANVLCQSIGSQTTDDPQIAFGDPSLLPDARQLDDAIEPGEIKAILDCDSSQMEAIVAARKGISFVLDGPPGTGKSQTIANIIADALSVGKRILFVSEKVAALEVVKRRLDDCGLGDFCLECHSSKANRKAVIEELKWCLEIPGECYPDPHPKLLELKKQRQALNDYVRILHQPQHPIGMSLYELHGQIARFTRLGLLGKTMVHFSRPEAISRSELDGWVSLLRLAPQFQRVISTYSSHPWRGCKLTRQSILLKSEIHHSFALLANCAEQFAHALTPLEEAKLIPSGTTPAQIKTLIASLEECLAIPNIPPAWLTAPKEIAEALLQRHKAYQTIQEKRRVLTEYVDDVTAHFSDDIALLSDMKNCAWLERLTCALPESYVECHKTLVNYYQILRTFESEIKRLDESFNQLIAELKLPIKEGLPLGAVTKLVSAARLIGSEAPLKTSWFDTERSAKIIAAVHNAISHLEAIAILEASIQNRIEPSQLLQLAEEMPDIPSLKHSWDFVRTNAAISITTSLEDYSQKLRPTIEVLQQIQSDCNAVSTALQLNDGFAPTISELQSLFNAVSPILESGFYHGSWIDPALRQRLKQQIEPVLLDLAEAHELRSKLENRLSHRAFLPTSRPLIEKGKRFITWWARLLGGFSNYRAEISDLYKGPVPETSVLLSDILQLATFHKRLSEVESIFDQLKGVLPAGLVVDQVDSWKEQLNAIDAFEGVLAAVPQIASALPAAAVQITMRSDDPVLSRLATRVDHTSWSTFNSELVATLGTANPRINDAFTSLAERESAVSRCVAASRSAQSKYRVAPNDFGQLLSDLSSAIAYSNHCKALEALFAEYSNDLPQNTQPYKQTGWQIALRGVDVAEKLVKTFGDSPVLKEIVTTPGCIDKDKLSQLATDTDLAINDLSRTWTEQVSFLTLTPPGQPCVEPKRRTTAELMGCVADAASKFEALSRQLSTLLVILRPGYFVPLERLARDAKTIKELRLAQDSVDACNLILTKYGIEDSHELSDEEVCASEWIVQAPDRLLKTRLAVEVSTIPLRRTQVQSILDFAQLTTGQISAPAQFFETFFNQDQSVSLGFIPKTLTIRELPEILRHLISAVESIDEWISFNRWRQEVSEAGLAVVVEELLNETFPPDAAADVVCAKLYQQLFDYLVSTSPGIGTFDGVRHELIRDKYRQLDEWEIKAASARVREYQLGREDRPRVGWLAPITSELGILKRETEKKRRHMPLRKLFSEIPGVLQRLKPCIMMSPLSVSTFLQAESLKFDLVIFDEASQVFPWDAIGAVYRGTQLIVAGDDKQLPPTSFFSRADIESEDEEDDIGDFESILSLCKSVNMPNKRLRWHYRSRREPLIAFSNKHFYGGDLVTFPSVRDAARDAVQLVFVPDGCWTERKNLSEARKVAELVVEHYRINPSKSLGVIAFNASQQQAIEDAIYDLRRSTPIVDALLKEVDDEPLFIKNLENVQGDERDVIFLSFGYGKNESGKFIKNFGPLSKPGGERRLNVAVTRARESVSLVASVRSVDMDLSGSTSNGAQLLKAYLEYAEHGVDSLSRLVAETQGNCESPFEEEVAAALIQHGLEPVPQVGCGGFRIDLALKHPSRPGLYCLGIECDGATYHSSKTARDRDRIRQSILEGLGWRICRVWSTDWVRNPESQIRRILDAYDQSMSQVSDFDGGLTTAVEVDFDDLQPQYVNNDESKAPTYLKIEEVPSEQIIETFVRIVTRVGTIDWSELVSLTSRELGFARTGKKIRERIEGLLHDQVKRLNLHRSGDRVSLP